MKFTKRTVRFTGLGITAALALGTVVGCGTSNTTNPSSNATGGSSNQTATNQANTTGASSNQTSANQTSNTTASNPPSASNAQFMEYTTSQSFDVTVSALKHSVSSNGMMVMGNLNQAGALKTTGLQLKGAESFFVGNPVSGKKMFQMNPAVGSELPMRVYVWVNNSGQTEIGYVKPSSLLGAVNPELGSSGAVMDKKLAMIVSQAKGTPAGQTSSGQNTQSISFAQSTSGKSFDATVTAFKHSVSSNGMMIMGNLNQAGALKTTGLQLKGAESFFVGNPVSGKKMFQMNPAVGTELPMRVYIWVDNSGKTHIGYFQPSTVLGTINSQLGMKDTMMDKKLSMIVKQATS